MPKSSKLLTALDAHKGKDFKIEKQKHLQKEAAKRKAKRAKLAAEVQGGEIGGAQTNGDETHIKDDGEDGWEEEQEEDEEEEGAKLVAEKNDNLKVPKTTDQATSPVGSAADSVSDEEEEEEEEDDEDDEASGGIPLSDIESLASDDKADIIPHQRLTINNTTALLAGHKAIALPASLSFSSNQNVTSDHSIEIADVHDDLTRELAFYKQCLDAAVEGRSRLMKEGVAFTRPSDYFAEMVKTDEHMGKIKAKMVDEAASKKASAEARKQRDLKKFGKQVQVAKLQERDKAKRETLEKINILKRKRKDADRGDANEENLFDVALDDAVAGKGDKNGDRRAGGRSKDKRQKKDEKYGFGGKKRFSKSGDAGSTGDMKSFSQKKMKGTKQRLGKSRRAKQV